MKMYTAAILLLTVASAAHAQGVKYEWTVAVTTAQREHTEGYQCAIRNEVAEDKQHVHTLIAQCLRIRVFGPIGPPIKPGPYIPPPGLPVDMLRMNNGVYNNCVLTFVAVNDTVLGSVQSLTCED